MDPDKIKSIIDWPVPKDVTDVRSYMGITRYYTKIIERFSRIANPINSLQKKGEKFIRDQKCKDNFTKLKTLLTMTPILKIVDLNKDFVVWTDACNEGLGGC